MSGWSVQNIPDQRGRTAVVTGANSGLGYVTARELARKGARVVLACRSEARGRDAVERLRGEVPGVDVELGRLDLGDLASVREFAGSLPYERLDLLVNNAGVMAMPYGTTADGFETQFGVNHLGHFALTGLLLPALLAAEERSSGVRVVTVSSMAHLLGNIEAGDLGNDGSNDGNDSSALNSERQYRRWSAYGRSKTANLLFTHELARSSRRPGPVLWRRPRTRGTRRPTSRRPGRARRGAGSPSG